MLHVVVDRGDSCLLAEEVVEVTAGCLSAGVRLPSVFWKETVLFCHCCLLAAQLAIAAWLRTVCFWPRLWSSVEL